MDGGVQRREAFFTRRPWLSYESAFCGIVMNSLTPSGVGEGACAPIMARRRFGYSFLFVQSQTEVFRFYLRKKELITITKEAWQGTPLVWWFLPRRVV